MLKKSDIYNGHIPTKRIGSSPSIKQKLAEMSYIEYFVYDGQYYYIDKRYESPFGFEYDLWQDDGENKLQHRVTGDTLPRRLTNYINRKKKINKILGKED